MTIPFISLEPLRALVAQETSLAVQRVLDSGQFIGGHEVTTFETALAKWLGAKESIACSNGTDALLIALQVMGVKRGDVVALPNITFWATFEVVAQLGAVPLLIDINRDDLQMNFAEFCRAHEHHRFRHAILPHLFGWTSPMLVEFRKFCAERDIALVEDGAQAAGVLLGGESVFSSATISTLSFYPAKVLGGCMDGGAITTNDADLAAKARLLTNHGRTQHYSFGAVGWNARMGGIAAAYLSVVLQHADRIVADRNAALRRYSTELKDGGWGKMVQLPASVRGNGYLQVSRCIGDPAVVQAALAERGIVCGRTYPETIADQVGARGIYMQYGDLEYSRAFAREVINLPLYFGMSNAAIETVLQAISSIRG